jgi:nucleotide-binding universal stress UspA family protein
MMEHENMASRSRLLVPLDGSELAERAIDPAIRIAHAMHATVLLAQINPLRSRSPVAAGSGSPPASHDQATYETADDQTYLDRVASRLKGENITIQTYTANGDVVSLLQDLELSAQVGLVVMTTHGRTGLARTALGSVADALVHHGSAPVLLIRASLPEERCSRLETALVPLDGSPASETVLHIVTDLAVAGLLRHVTLLRVVEPESGITDSDARRYLTYFELLLSTRLPASCPVATEVTHGRAAERILQRVHGGCDMVIMTTRSTPGLARAVFGSVADRLLHDADTPLLLVHPQTET